MGSPRGPSAAKRKPSGRQNRQRHPKASPRATKTSQEDKLYINKLPINRLRGRYVIDFNILYLIELPIELPIVLPIALPIVLPIV